MHNKTISKATNKKNNTKPRKYIMTINNNKYDEKPIKYHINHYVHVFSLFCFYKLINHPNYGHWKHKKVWN